MTEKQYRMLQFKELARQNKKLDAERKKMTKAHADYLSEDIKEIYAAMAVTLWENGVSHDEIVDLIQDIARTWEEHVRLRPERGYKTMNEYCNELTGIDLRQNVESV